MPEAQLTEPLDHADEKGHHGPVRRVGGGGQGRRGRVPRTRRRRTPGLRDPLADGVPSSARHGKLSRQGDWRAAFVAELAAEIDALSGPRRSAAQDFEAIEQALRRRALGLVAQGVDGVLRRGRFRPFGFDDGVRPPPEDLHHAVGTAEAAPRLLPTAPPAAGESCPCDRLRDAPLSPATARLVGLAATSVSFAEASEWMGELAGVAVDPNRSSAPLKRWAARSRPTNAGGSIPHPLRRRCVWGWMGLDGTGAPVRKSEVEGWRGKQPDASARTREVKLVTVWTAETRNADGLPERDPGSVSYSAAVESAASRFSRVRSGRCGISCMRRRRPTRRVASSPSSRSSRRSIRRRGRAWPEDRGALSFFGFPAEHWLHLRTSNVIESVFATVRLRQRVTKRAGSRTKGLLMAYKLVAMAQRRWLPADPGAPAALGPGRRGLRRWRHPAGEGGSEGDRLTRQGPIHLTIPPFNAKLALLWLLRSPTLHPSLRPTATRCPCGAPTR